MATVDAHQHFWWMAHRTHAWPDVARERMSRDFTPDDLLPEMRKSGVDGTVLIQVANEVPETEEFIDLARKHPFIRGVVGWVPLIDPTASERALDALTGDGILVGIRHLISFEPDPDWLLQPAVLESLRGLARRKIVFDAVPADFRQMEAVFKVAGQIPSLKVAMNHLARPPVPDQGWEPWATMIKRAAAYPNMSLKFSPGMDLVSRWHWSTPMVKRYADHIFESFGADRVMAASNWPVSLLGGSFGEIWHGITELVADLSAHEQKKILGGTAEAIYRLRS
jgi:L-fuconolactonase